MTAGKKFKRLVRERARKTGQSYMAARHHLLSTHSLEDEMADNLVEVDFDVPMEQDGERIPKHFPLDQLRTGGVEFAPAVEFTDGAGRQLRMYIGQPEATAIIDALHGRSGDRPMTHDAFKQAVDALGGRPRAITLTYVSERTIYLADVELERGPDADVVHLDCRPSDAIALAARCNPRPRVLIPESLLASPPG